MSKDTLKTLGTLIRLARREVDSARLALSILEERRQQIRDDQVSLEGDLAREAARATDTRAIAFSYASYAAGVRTRQAALDEEAASLVPDIALAAEALREAVAELKRLEILDERMRAEAAAEEGRRSQAALDEAAILRHARAS